MSTLLKSFALLLFLSIFISCGGDDDPEPTGTPPTIEFRTNPPYMSQDLTLPGGTLIVIGATATRTEDDDPLKTFTLTESVNGGTPTTHVTQELTGTQQDSYFRSYTQTLGNTSGETHKYTFKVTTEKGLSDEVSLTITIF